MFISICNCIAVVCLARMKESVCITRAARTDDVDCRHSIGLQLWMQSTADDDGAVLTSAQLSPYMQQEYALISDTGKCEIRHLYREEALRSMQATARYDCSAQSWQCSFGMHPRDVIITDRTGVAIYDVRCQQLSGARAHTDLLTTPHASLNTNVDRERVYVHRQHAKSTYHHFVVTSNNLLLVDQRFANHPVLKWSHLLLSPPMYANIVYDVTKLISSGACHYESTQTPLTSCDDVLLLGCQEYPECHAFQFNLGSGEVHPYWNGLPWRVSGPWSVYFCGVYLSLQAFK